MSEIILSHGKIEITSTMARFGNTTYPIAGIGAVSIEDDPSPLKKLGIIVAGVGVVWAAVQLKKPESPLEGIATALVGLAVWWIGKRASGLKIMLRTSSGDQQAFASKDTDFVKKLKKAIEIAVTTRG